MKEIYVFGNWKLNKTTKELVSYFSYFNQNWETFSSNSQLIFGLAMNNLLIPYANFLKTDRTLLLAQDVSPYLDGNYTGQTSCLQLLDNKVKHVIIGHYETRKYFCQKDEDINAKAKILLKNKMQPIICLGAIAYQDKINFQKSLQQQIKTIFYQISSMDIKNCFIAYEPKEAIGANEILSITKIAAIISFIHKELIKLYGKQITHHIKILYGGSVNLQNCLSILKIRKLSGILIGRASLDPHIFCSILQKINAWTK